MGNYHVRFGKKLLTLSLINQIGVGRLTSLIITAHAFIIIFFLVNNLFLFFNLINKSLKFYLSPRNINPGSNLIKYNSLKVKNNVRQYSSITNNNELKNNYSHPFVKVVIDNPYENRDLITVAKNKVGVYIFEILDKKDVYVGHSINLYSRICSYFIPSILKTKVRYVLKYFNKYGFKNVKLTILILKSNATVVEALE